MNSAAHLTDDQIDDVFIGDLAQNCASHLAGCPECQARVAEMESTIASFKNVSLAWSERQSATMPVRPVAMTVQAPYVRGAVWAAAITVVAVVGVAVPLAHRGTKAPVARAESVAPQTFVAEREEQIAQDNRMLRAIDRELDARVSSPSETFGLESGDDGRRSGRNAPIRN